MITINEVLRRLRRRYPSKVAVVDHAGRRTYGELIDRAWALGRGLLEAGVRPGDNVGVLTGNSNFSAETYLGIVAAGAVAVPYSWRWTDDELVHGINDSGAAVVLVERAWLETFERVMGRGDLERVTTVVVEGEAYESFLRPGGDPRAAVTLDAPNLVLYTGGTTGFSKGVVLSHRAVMANSLNEIIDTDMEHDDVTLLITPMYHAASMLCWFLPHLVLGATSVFMREFDEQRVVETMRRESVTNGFLVPNMVRRMLRARVLDGVDLPSYRRLYVGGATFKRPDKEAVTELLPELGIYFQYGLTEAGCIVSVLRPEDTLRPVIEGSIGREFTFAQVEIQDPESGAEMNVGEVGELCVRGPSLMTGYYGKEDATAAAFRGDWLRSGDLASRDADGFLYLHDRLKDMIKTGGENVYSQEVERVLYDHPAIAEAAVIGVPSDEWDEEVRAVVALRDGANLTEAEVRDHCRRHLAAFKVPKRVAIVEMLDIPVNASGKIVKQQVRATDYWRDDRGS